ncbi:MAG: hypothetical protein WCE63_16790 [Acidobacteriaceae bacterium]
MHRGPRSQGIPTAWIGLGTILGLFSIAADAGLAASGARPNFGPNVLVFAPSMPAAAMQQQIDKVYAIQRRNEFGPQRNALLFLPGKYKVDVSITVALGNHGAILNVINDTGGSTSTHPRVTPKVETYP